MCINLHYHYHIIYVIYDYVEKYGVENFNVLIG